MDAHNGRLSIAEVLEDGINQRVEKKKKRTDPDAKVCICRTSYAVVVRDA